MKDHKEFYLNLYKGVIIKLTRTHHNSVSSLSIEEKLKVKELFKLLRAIYIKIILYEDKRTSINYHIVRKCIFNYLHHIKIPSTKI